MNNIRVRVAGVLEKDNKILFIQHKKNGLEYWLLPGGGVDYGETFHTALKREFMEETNLEIEVRDMLFISESIDPEGSRHIVNFVFRVEYISGEIHIGNEAILGELQYIEKKAIIDYTIYPNIKKELITLDDENGKIIRYLENRWE